MLRSCGLIILLVLSLFVLAYSSGGDDEKASGSVGNPGQDIDSSTVNKNNCIPNCKDKQCGDDGCNGKCGDCGDNAKCDNFKCVCNKGYLDCDGNMSNGCEKQISDKKHIWSKNFKADRRFMDSGQVAIALDGSENIYIGGSFESTNIELGGVIYKNADNSCNKNRCYSDIFIAKFDKNGNYLWSKSFGGASIDIINSIAVDLSGNIYILGYFNSYMINFGGGDIKNASKCDELGCGTDIFLAKFDSNGNHIWSKGFGGSDCDWGYSISLDSIGNLYITGHFNSSTIDFGGGALKNAGDRDIFLAKFDSNGNHIWSKRFGGDGSDSAYSISIDSTSNIYITGAFHSSTMNFGGSAIKNASKCDKLGCRSDIFLAKFDSNGNHLWSKRFGGNYYDYGKSVSLDSSGNVYITGYFGSSTIDFGGGKIRNAINCSGKFCPSDIFLAKFDSNGKHKWSKRFGGGSDDIGSSVSLDSSGNVYITGWFWSSTIDFGGGALKNAGKGDIFLAKFDSNGNHLWSKRFGGSGTDWGCLVSVDRMGNIYGTGYFEGTDVDFGGCPLSSAGENDIFFIKYAP